MSQIVFRFKKQDYCEHLHLFKKNKIYSRRVTLFLFSDLHKGRINISKHSLVRYMTSALSAPFPFPSLTSYNSH